MAVSAGSVAWAWFFALFGVAHTAASAIAFVTFIFTPVTGMDATQKEA